ncbi:STAS domain-containing protein [Jatrophihabitans sp. YIM 134969]
MTTAGDMVSEGDRARWFVGLLDRRGDEVLAAWNRLQVEGSATRGSVGDTRELGSRSEAVLSALRSAVQTSGRIDEPSGPEFETLRRIVEQRAVQGARDGLSPTEVAHGVLALREALFSVLQTEHEDESVTLTVAATISGRVVDSLALLTFEFYVRAREEVIARQSHELLDLSTPVVQLWDGVLAVPLVGTLDSARAQVVMETLLEAIVRERAEVAILDITGVPTVDTQVAQHLLKTVTATRLMGADCIISGIGPQTAQTIVQLGIQLQDITTRATLADALATAISRLSPAHETVTLPGA